MSPDNGVPLLIAIIIVLGIVNAFIAASRRALDNTDHNRIKEQSEDDPTNRRLQHVLEFLQMPSRYHYADIFISYVIFAICVILFHRLIANQWNSIWQIVGDILFVIIFMGLTNILPKKIASQASDTAGITLTGFQRMIYYISLPFVKLSVMIANLILIILRKEIDVDDQAYSEDKVLSLIDRGQQSGDIKEEAHRMIDSIFEFDDLLAYEIMTPRTDVFMIDIDDPREEYFEELMELRYSRIPVFEDDPDNIIGILHIKDYLLQASHHGFDHINIRELIREPYLVPETKNIDALFVELQKEKNHIAILIDEYGGFSGLVSIEDIIEQIVGDIDDEFDEEDRVIERINDTTFIVDGNVYLDDLDEETDIELESETSETIGGYIIDQMGEIPKEHVKYPPIRVESYAFTILEVKDRRIEKVKIEILDDGAEEHRQE